MAYALPYSGQQQALTYGRRRKRPTYLTEIIEAEASQLPALYALKERREQMERGEALEREGIASAEAMATQEREQTERLAEQSRKSQELIASRRQELEDLMSQRAISSQEQIAEANRKLAEREAEISKVLGFGGLAVSGVQTARELWPEWGPDGWRLGGAGVGAGAGYALTRKKKPKYQALGTAAGATLGYFAQDIAGGAKSFYDIIGNVSGLW